MFWMRKAACQVGDWRAERARWRADMERYKAAKRAARKAGVPEPENPGPPPTGFALLPWLLMGMGSFSNLLQGRTPLPWLGAVGLLVFNSLYIYVTFRAFVKETRDARSTRVALVVMGDGTARRSRAAPGYWDERAEGFDTAVLAALAAGDSAALAALDLELAAELLCAGAPAWVAAGGLLSGARMNAEVRYEEVPFGVQYLVASWSARG
jgi:hypothetical protein